MCGYRAEIPSPYDARQRRYQIQKVVVLVCYHRAGLFLREAYYLVRPPPTSVLRSLYARLPPTDGNDPPDQDRPCYEDSHGIAKTTSPALKAHTEVVPLPSLRTWRPQNERTAKHESTRLASVKIFPNIGYLLHKDKLKFPTVRNNFLRGMVRLLCLQLLSWSDYGYRLPSPADEKVVTRSLRTDR